MRQGYQLSFALLATLFPVVWFLSPDTAKWLTRALLLLFLVGFALRDPPMHRDRVIQLCGLLAVAVVAGYLWQRATLPEDLFTGSSAKKYVSAFCFFVVLAYGTRASYKHLPFLLLFSAAAGLLIHLAWFAPESHWTAGWRGTRVDFGFRNAQHTGVLFATALLAGAIFLPRLLTSCTPRVRILIAPLGIAFVMLMLFGTLVTQVRGAWLGLVVAAVVLSSLGTVSLLFGHRLTHRQRMKRGAAAGMALALVVSGLVYLEADKRVVKRIASESVSIEALGRMARLEEIPLTSIGVRVASWAASLEWIAERPIFGWGGRSASRLIRHSPHFDERFKSRFGHLHNSYLETLVTVGGAAVACMAGVVLLVGWRVTSAWRNGRIPTDVFVFAWAFFAFWTVANLFESYIMYDSGFYLNALIGGFVYAWCLRADPAATPLSRS